MRMNLSTRLLGACAGILLQFGPACAAQSIDARIDAFVKAEMTRQNIPGLSLVVLRNGEALFSRGYGIANVEHQVPVKPETVFQSGSIGKQFTAMAVLLLVEEGKVSLEDPIDKLLPDTPAAWKNITVRRLLNHTSGMGDYPPDFDLRRDYTEDELLAIIKSTPLDYRPGEGWEYSNLGYVLAGILVHKLSGEFYGDYLAEKVFRPLGMTAARVISETDIVPNRAAGYRLVDGQLKNQEWVAPSINTTADGSLYLTTLDMARWDAALAGGHLLRQTTLKQMWTPTVLGDGTTRPYGFGWHTDVLHGKRVVYHGGAWQGFKSFIVRLPDERLTIVFFANLWQANEMRIARGLVSLFHPEFALPAGTPIKDDEPQVTALVRRALGQLAREAVDLNRFTPEAQAALVPDQARTIAASLNALSVTPAVIGTMDLMERKQESGERIRRYALTDMGRTLICTVRLTSDDRIASLQLREE